MGQMQRNKTELAGKRLKLHNRTDMRVTNRPRALVRHTIRIQRKGQGTEATGWHSSQDNVAPMFRNVNFRHRGPKVNAPNLLKGNGMQIQRVVTESINRTRNMFTLNIPCTKLQEAVLQLVTG